MTMNQIAYHNMRENQRSNLARERETYRSNVVREEETHRSNLAKENIQWYHEEGQRARWKVQSGVDIANAVTGGIKNVAKGFESVMKSIPFFL
jgi:hypothetical protein